MCDKSDLIEVDEKIDGVASVAPVSPTIQSIIIWLLVRLQLIDWAPVNTSHSGILGNDTVVNIIFLIKGLGCPLAGGVDCLVGLELGGHEGWLLPVDLVLAGVQNVSCILSIDERLVTDNSWVIFVVQLCNFSDVTSPHLGLVEVPVTVKLWLDALQVILVHLCLGIDIV